MAKTEKLSYHNAEKYANELWVNCENETDTRLKLSNRMIGLVLADKRFVSVAAVLLIISLFHGLIV